ESVLSPEGDIGNLELADVIDSNMLQKIIDDFYQLTKIPMAIIDLKGKTLVGVGWQKICTKFHRVNPETCRYCVESDTQLTMGVKPGEFRLYKCKNNMWDVATPLVIGNRQFGNIFMGQFFFEDEKIDYELFRSQAKRYGFDEKEYLLALDSVPRLSRENMTKGMNFLAKAAHFISTLSYSNIKLAKLFAERDALTVSLRESEKRLMRTNENLEQFAYVASHDLQEPLRIMGNYSQLLEKRYKNKLDQDADVFIGYIVSSAKHMQKLITDLLTYSRIGKLDESVNKVDCNSILGKVIISLTPLIEDARAIITHDHLPVSLCNETTFVQLFQNLITNAIKFRKESEQPRIHIGAKMHNDEWLFSVRDNGIGIDDKYKDKIFMIFQRLHGRDKYPGTGIGLSICKKIVEGYGGRIWMESKVGDGSVFYFTIPVNRQKEAVR
ncbi:MAG: PocR ligand-binding domain-containing protein, partial [Candidatus Omnitrophota bacterium]